MKNKHKNNNKIKSYNNKNTDEAWSPSPKNISYDSILIGGLPKFAQDMNIKKSNDNEIKTQLYNEIKRIQNKNCRSLLKLYDRRTTEDRKLEKCTFKPEFKSKK